jgi:LysR family transcriptional regulator for bpeEF and oprC
MSLLQRLSDMATFAKVVESRSFTQAAVALDMSKGAVSKAISRLEQHLNVRLLQRSTRQLSLTSEGEAFFEYCQQVVAQADQAEHHLSELRDEPSGLIRISVPVTFGTLRIAPLLPELLKQYPKLSVELDLNDKVVDLIADKMDLGMRFGRLANSSLIARSLPGLPITMVASPGYLEAFGSPQSPADLCQHQCLSSGSSIADRTWFFRYMDQSIEVLTSGRVLCNSNRALKHAALADMGLLFVTRYQVEKELQNGSLVEVMQDYMPEPLPLHLVYPNRHHMKAGLKVVIQFFQQQFATG